ncbi:hypothetical protein BS50DRAFT_98578 [Corynespora cassiicola Philippines]|uniref:Uncharacterized protein n=1 Tax=Corynespora cassiicola Philippines TaxID=1448308 RepID=A0A2T2NFH5_CORCC|nr:hypothetical protein BS50DRAFT_98578 [Corynespora cassiicola Philippines]
MLKDDQSGAPEQPISEGFEKTGKEERKTALELELEEQMAKMEQDFVRQIQVLKKEKRDQSDEIKSLRMQHEKWIYEFDDRLRNAKAGRLAKTVGRVRMERRSVLTETMRMVKAAFPSREPAPPPAGRDRESPRIGSLRNFQQSDDDSYLLEQSHQGTQDSLTHNHHLYEKYPQQQVPPQRTQSLDSISQGSNAVNSWLRFPGSSSTANMLENTKYSTLRRSYQ